jgi:Sigma-70 region 2
MIIGTHQARSQWSLVATRPVNSMTIRPTFNGTMQSASQQNTVADRVSPREDHVRFGNVVLPHLDDAYGLARWLTGNRTDAEDVVQEACLRAFHGIGSFSNGNSRAWLLTIVRNAAYSWLLKNRPAARPACLNGFLRMRAFCVSNELNMIGMAVVGLRWRQQAAKPIFWRDSRRGDSAARLAFLRCARPQKRPRRAPQPQEGLNLAGRR